MASWKLLLIRQHFPIVIFRSFFSISYFFLISPFRLVKKSGISGTHFIAGTCLAQKLACAFSLICFTITYSKELTFPTLQRSQPASYFLLIQTYISALHSAFWLGLLWSRKQKFVEIANIITKHGTTFPVSIQALLCAKSFAGAASILLLFPAVSRIASVSINLVESNQTSDGTFGRWWHGMVQKGREQIFLKSYFTNISATYADHLLGIIALVGFIQRFFF